ncbi:7190_t:CDS:2, partial [Gigaspora rosea]
PEELHRKFLDALPLPWLEKAEDIKDIQKTIQNALAQQKNENQILVKKVTELESQIAKQIQVPALQTVKPKNYPIKPFQRSRPQQSNIFARIDRIENAINEERDVSNYTRSYFTPLKPIYSQYIPPNLNNSEEDKVTEFKQNEKVTMPNLFPELDNQLLELLSLAMRKKLLTHLQKINKLKSLEYMQSLNETLGWILGIAQNFSLRHNSDYIMKLVEGYKNIPISVKYKNKWVTETEHVVVIDDKKPDYLLCLGTAWIRKVQEILDTNKHEFRMIVCGKSYIIPTFTKPIKNNISSSLYTTVIQDNNSKNKIFDSSTKIDTKEEPASNEEKESQVSDSFTKDLKKHNRF